MRFTKPLPKPTIPEFDHPNPVGHLEGVSLQGTRKGNRVQGTEPPQAQVLVTQNQLKRVTQTQAPARGLVIPKPLFLVRFGDPQNAVFGQVW